MPPVTAALESIASTPTVVRCGTTAPLSSSRPATSVRNSSSFAPCATAIAAAAVSAFTLNSAPSLPMATDETTGIVPDVSSAS